MKSVCLHKVSVVLVFWLMLCACVGFKAQINMQVIQFTPKEFSDVEAMFDTNAEHSLTPFYPHFFCELNNIRINAPEKIIVTAKDSGSKLIIPLCGYCHVSIKRAMKYAEQEEYLIHIKKIEAEDWYCGEIWQPSVDNEVIDTEAEEERQIAIEKAKSYSDDELDEGGGAFEAFNVDVLKFVQFIPESGIYEIYVSTVGLESNHMQVEIVFEK